MGKWTRVSKSDSLNPGLWIVSEVTQRRKEGPKAVTPVCGSARAPASVLTSVHTRFCSPPINSGDSQISFQHISFLLLLAEQQWPVGFCCLPLKNSDGERIYLSHYPAGVRSRRHCPHPQFTDWELGLRGPEWLAQISRWGRGRAIVRSHSVDLCFRDTSLRFTWRTLFRTQRGCI